MDLTLEEQWENKWIRYAITNEWRKLSEFTYDSRAGDSNYRHINYTSKSTSEIEAGLRSKELEYALNPYDIDPNDREKIIKVEIKWPDSQITTDEYVCLHKYIFHDSSGSWYPSYFVDHYLKLPPIHGLPQFYYFLEQRQIDPINSAPYPEIYMRLYHENKNENVDQITQTYEDNFPELKKLFIAQQLDWRRAQAMVQQQRHEPHVAKRQ